MVSCILSGYGRNESQKSKTQYDRSGFCASFLFFPTPRKIKLNFFSPLHRGTGPAQTPEGSHSNDDGPLSRYPQAHLNVALPQAVLFNSTNVKWASSMYNGGHCTGWQLGGGDDQFPDAKQVELAVPSSVQPSGQLYNARCPNLFPSNRNWSGAGGSLIWAHMDTATTITMLLVNPRGVAQV